MPVIRPSPAYTTPECRLGFHSYCPGNTDIRRAGAPPHEAPIEKLRCACPCEHPHRSTPPS
ncbi:hypothetical protein ABZ769_03120 [Streptomyces olivoreticuli]